MGCFLVPAAEAVVVTVINKAVISKKEAAEAKVDACPKAEAKEKSPFLRKLSWLKYMLWGGSFLLAFEHLWHGELTPWFPFLTAAGSPEEAAIMLHEMATAGVMMAALVTAVWAGMVLVTNFMEKKVIAPKTTN